MSDLSLTPSPREIRILADAMSASSFSVGTSPMTSLNVSAPCCQ